MYIFKCRECNSQWDAKLGCKTCPKCGSTRIEILNRKLSNF